MSFCTICLYILGFPHQRGQIRFAFNVGIEKLGAEKEQDLVFIGRRVSRSEDPGREVLTRVFDGFRVRGV